MLRRVGLYATGSCCPINQNQALFSLLGTTFGGDGQTSILHCLTLRGNVPIHVGQGFTLGQRAGNRRTHLRFRELPTARAPRRNASTTNGSVAFAANNILRGGWEPLCRPGQSGRDKSHDHCKFRRQPGPLKHAAVSGAEFLYRASGNLPQPKLRSRIYGTTICR